MRLVFNHLLMRVLNLASERLRLMVEQKQAINRWSAQLNEQPKHYKHVQDTVENLLKNNDYVTELLKALEESKPKLTTEQEKIVALLRQTFRWAMAEYKTNIELAGEVKFDRKILEEFEKVNQSVSQPPPQPSPPPQPPAQPTREEEPT
jgi:oligoendopeptidase F